MRPILAGSFCSTHSGGEHIERAELRQEALPNGEVRVSGCGLSLTADARAASVLVRDQSVTICLGISHQAGEPGSRAVADVAEHLATGKPLSGLQVADRFAVVDVDLLRRRVLLVTDRFGSVPLCYRAEPGRISFSDRADNLCVGQGEKEIDLQAVYDFAYFHFIPSPRTIFSRIRRVEPATAIRYSSGLIKKQRTWVPDYGRQASFRFPEAASRLLELIRASVARNVRSSNRPGAYLSGGTDSSTVVGCLAEITERAPDAFSIGFDAAGFDEMEYAKIAARHFGARHHIYYVSPGDVADEFEKVVASYDQPFGNSSALPAYFCARMAKSEGIDELLAGDGGDEIFGGNARYAKQKLFDAYLHLPALLRASLVEPLLLGDRGPRGLPGLAKVSSYVAQARLPMPARMETYNLLGRFGADNVFTDTFLAAVSRESPQELQREVYEDSLAPSLVDRMLAYDWRFTLADNDLPKVVGTAAMAGVAVGFPLLDDAIVDLSIEVPSSMKLRGLRLRHFYKEALRNFLPDAIIHKKKHGFGLPFGLWLADQRRLMDLAQTALARLVERGLVRKAFVEDLLGVRLREHSGYFGEMVWVLCVLEHWLSAKAPEFRLR